jgi:hypothetical protein
MKKAFLLLIVVILINGYDDEYDCIQPALLL